jgi:hypothetical protein
MRKGRADAARDIDGLHFERAKIRYPPTVIVGNEYNVNVPGRTPILIIQAYFGN